MASRAKNNLKEFNKRKKLFVANKYQKRIISLTFVPTLLICVFISAILSIFLSDLADVILNKSAAVGIQLITQWGIFMVCALWMLFTVIMVWSYNVSRNLVGAFERIFAELDHVLEGGEKRKIYAREKDELANALLNRINDLIEHYNPKK